MQKRKEWLQCADIQHFVTISFLHSFAIFLQKGGGKGVTNKRRNDRYMNCCVSFILIY